MSECICGADEACTGRCEKHDRDLHLLPCFECGREWQQANPNTSAAIARIASGKGSTAALAAARRADAAPVKPRTQQGGSEGDE